MKNLIHSFWIFLSLSLSMSVIGQNNCLPNTLGCVDVGITTNTIFIASHPTCPITLTYDLRICAGVFQISNIRNVLIPFNQDCNQLLTELFSAFFSGNPLLQQTTLSAFNLDLETAIANLIWQQTFNSSLASGTTGLLRCNGGITLFTVSFYRSACASFCVGKSVEGGISITQALCGTACCQKNINFCLDDNGMVQTTESIAQITPGLCITSNIPACGEEAWFQSPCFPICQP